MLKFNVIYLDIIVKVFLNSTFLLALLMRMFHLITALFEYGQKKYNNN